MYWFKVSFLRGVSPRSTDLGDWLGMLGCCRLCIGLQHVQVSFLRGVAIQAVDWFEHHLCIGLRCRFCEV